MVDDWRLGGQGSAVQLGDRLEVLQRLGSVASKFEAIVSYVEDFGFSDVFYGHMPVGGGDPIVLRRWDHAWESLYTSRRYDMCDEAIRLGRQSERPFSLRPQGPPLSPRQAEFYRAAEAHNRLNGFAVPFSSPSRGLSGISVTGASSAPSEGVQLTIAAIAYIFDISVGVQRAADACQAYNITPRQVLLIRLLSEGHSHVEIAELLGISEDWAHKSFARLRERLGVRTDPALVRRALELNLLT